MSLVSCDIKLNASQLETLSKYIDSMPGNAENLINEYLQEKASDLSIESITLILPESGRKFKGKHPHRKAAKHSNPFESDFVNLGFKIKSSNKFNYLYFPDQGKGTSRKNMPLEFMDEGIQNILDTIIYGIQETLVSD